MRVSVRLLAAVFAVASVLPCALSRTNDEEKPAAKADKPAEKPATDRCHDAGRTSTWAGSTSPTTRWSGPSPWAQPMRRMRNWAWTESRSRAASWRTRERQGAEGCIAYGAHVLRGLLQERREGRRPADHVLLQRRAGQFDGVAAHGLAGPQARGDERRPAPAGRAVQPGRQCRIPCST